MPDRPRTSAVSVHRPRLSGRDAVRTALLPLVLGAATGVATATLLVPGRGGLAATLPLPGAEAVDLGLRWTARVVTPEALLGAARDGLVATAASLGVTACLLALGAVATLITAAGSVWRRELAVRGALGEGLRALMGRLLGREGPRMVVGLLVGSALGAAAAVALHLGWPFPRGSDDPFPALAVALWCVAVPAGFAVVCGVLTALPARYGHRRLAASLTAGSRATADPWEGGLRRIASVFQVAGSIALLAAALLLLKALPRAGPVSGDAASDDVVILSAVVGVGPSNPEERSRRYAALLERLRALPTVASESIATPGAWTGVAATDNVLVDCGVCPRGGLALPFLGERVVYHAVSPGFFGDAGFRVVDGRDFRVHETGPVAIVNVPFALKDFEDGKPVGRQIRVGAGLNDWYTVVGVVQEETPPGLGRTDRPPPALYLSALQHPPDRFEVAFRAMADTAVAARSVRAAVQAAGLVPAGGARTAGELRRRRARPLTWAALAAVAMGLVALLSALLGTSRVAAIEVAARRRELGIRLAVGATPTRITRYVLARVARATLLGAVLGVPLTVAVAARMREVLGDVPVFDPVGFGLLAATLLVAAVLGALRPAREAARTPPRVVMAEE